MVVGVLVRILTDVMGERQEASVEGVNEVTSDK